MVLFCVRWRWDDPGTFWVCITEADPIMLEVCQNGEVPPACIAEDAFEPPEWSPSDTIGGSPPGSGDGIPEAPACDDDDPICEGSAPPELICPQSHQTCLSSDYRRGMRESSTLDQGIRGPRATP